ncbi:MAG: hypothetical protein COX07_02435 [Bacteroidetes bacterium CG23_combo_of_CG06-09_8_20_14_all_32_9]|nr:MAG: hypothetical protein COX07_02435 [Bacteroidetes bacterium CG23_combo_of_CG06-09_8_20_14_all_32_9]
MNYTKYLLFIYFLFYSGIYSLAQNPKPVVSVIEPFPTLNPKLDSLLHECKKAIADTARIKLYLGIGDIYENTKPDSAIYYYQKAQSLAEKKLATSQSSTIKVINTIKKYLAISCRYIGTIYLYQGLYDKAIEYYLKSLKITKEIGDKKEMAKCYNNIGMVHDNEGSYDKAIEYYFKSLKIFEELSKQNEDILLKGEAKKGMSQCYNNIGIVHTKHHNYDKAIEYYFKSLKIFEELSKQQGNAVLSREAKKGMAQCYNNIGNVHYYQGSYDNAIEYYLKSLKIKEELNDKKGMSNCYNNIGGIYIIQSSYDKAIESYLKSLKIREELGDENGIAQVWSNISELHITLADSVAVTNTEKNKHYNEAIKYALKAINLAKEINAMSLVNCNAAHLQQVYKALGNISQSLYYAELFIATKDSMFAGEKTIALAEMETKYKAEKKQLEIDKLEKQKALDNETMQRQKAESKRQQVIIFSFIFGFIIILTFSVIISRLFLQKKKANVLLLKQREEISTQRDEIEAQRDKLSNQNNLLTGQKKEITDSIIYARRIQQAMLPDLFLTLSKEEGKRSFIGGGLDEVFILFKPKDIVSGDFYWATIVETSHALSLHDTHKILVVAVADCTGHGVPGAFMSILGISFLNEIVRKKEVTQASQILDQLRISIIDALKQKDISSDISTLLSVKDGMDIALVAINMETLECQFAGANNSLYIVSNSKFQISNSRKHNSEGDKLSDKSSGNPKPEISNLKPETNDLLEIKGDKMPVAIYVNMKPFTNKSVQLNKGDIIYLTSDGYKDQFGGPNNKKFKAKQLKELLIDNCNLSMKEQKDVLENTLVNWIGRGEQIDDITMLGIKI